MANRIRECIDVIEERLALLDVDALERIDETATLDFDEWCVMGDWSSRAHVAGIMTGDEAQLLHQIHTDFTSGRCSLAERVVFMQVMVEVGEKIVGVAA